MLSPDTRPVVPPDPAEPGISPEAKQSFEDLMTRLAASLDSFGPEGHKQGAGKDPKQMQLDLEADAIQSIMRMADSFPDAWHRFRRWLAGLGMTYAKMQNDVDVRMDPVKSHAQRCWNAGAAKMMAWVAYQLAPERLEQKLQQLRAGGRIVKQESHVTERRNPLGL